MRPSVLRRLTQAGQMPSFSGSRRSHLSQRRRSCLRLITALRLCELLDAARRLGEFGRERQGVGDHGHDLVGLGGDFQLPATDQRLVAGGLDLGNGNQKRDNPIPVRSRGRLRQSTSRRRLPNMPFSAKSPSSRISTPPASQCRRDSNLRSSPDRQAVVGMDPIDLQADRQAAPVRVGTYLLLVGRA